jgi:hypothetical protein
VAALESTTYLGIASEKSAEARRRVMQVVRRYSSIIWSAGRLCEFRVDNVWILMPVIDANPHLYFRQLQLSTCL